MNNEELTKKDDQTMATLGRVTAGNYSYGQPFLTNSIFDCPFYKEQCQQVFDDMQSQDITKENYKSFFTAQTDEKYQQNVGYFWLKSFAKPSHKLSKHVGA